MTKESLMAMGLTEEQATKVMEGLNGSFVTKTRFNEVNEELKTAKATITERDGQLNALKTSGADAAALQAQITQLQADNAAKDQEHAAEIKKIKIENAVEKALTDAKAINPATVKPLLAAFLEKADLDDDGTIRGLADEIGKLAKAEAFIISGCCQSDWQAGFCPVEEWSREALEVFETEYFNTGSEWIIHDEDGEPESPEEVTGYSVYCVGWNDEQIKRELADAAGESDPAAVVLFKFTGWSRCPEYERAV